MYYHERPGLRHSGVAVTFVYQPPYVPLYILFVTSANAISYCTVQYFVHKYSKYLASEATSVSRIATSPTRLASSPGCQESVSIHLHTAPLQPCIVSAWHHHGTPSPHFPGGPDRETCIRYHIRSISCKTNLNDLPHWDPPPRRVSLAKSITM
ncbi:hypothetical protein K504DRAFT_299621 [Pleomassaria siparia CBS 279.74]|uniref:Uncharacterized protein n=1 Tax=Pleomassaria siparia CBS 279.74 TaxID=1314801 RepID=A0A6G1K5G9_9PLEO|nr:hypothetical protein K504DRAFT_299621 [Pleomassaria siparia CBS 279.74]